MRVLVADDTHVWQRMLDKTLRKWGYDVVLVDDGQAALQALTAPEAPEMALLDWVMPGMDGIDVCREVRKAKADSALYVIILTARESKEDTVAALEAGADDYLTKPFHPEELHARLRVGERIVGLQKALQRAYERALDDSLTDPLTGLRTRRGFREVLTEHIEHARRTGDPVSVMMADIDHFKRINDTYGHQAGDEVLGGLADIFCHSLREGVDTASRHGGEEFAFILPRTRMADALDIAERIRLEVEDQIFPTEKGPLRATISIGIATYDPLESRYEPTPEKLLAAADENLYRAKTEGRNRVAA